MTPRIKPFLLALTIIAAGVLPVLSLEAFLYVLGACFGVIGIVALVMLCELWTGFRKFEAATLAEFQRLDRRVRGPRPFIRLVRR